MEKPSDDRKIEINLKIEDSRSDASRRDRNTLGSMNIFRNKTKLILTVIAVSVFAFVIVQAGSLSPSSLPAATMHSLTELYNAVASTFDSSGISANQNGSLMQMLKYVDANVASLAVSSNSIDFDEIVNSMTLDADTTIASAGFNLLINSKVTIGDSVASAAFGKLVVGVENGTNDRQYAFGATGIDFFRQRSSWPCCSIGLADMAVYGNLAAQGFTTEYPAADISFITDDGWGGSGTVPVAIRFLNAPAGSPALLERMRISSDGNVGIGDTSYPAVSEQKLTVAGNILASTSGNVDLILRSSTATGNDGMFTFRTGSASDRFDVINGAGTKLMTIASTGYVGIASSSPNAKLVVNGSQITRGHSAFGDAAMIDWDSFALIENPSVVNVVEEFDSELTAFASYPTGINAIIRVNPSSTPGDYVGVYGASILSYIETNNAQNFSNGYLYGANIGASQYGTGNIPTIVGVRSFVQNYIGTATDITGVTISVSGNTGVNTTTNGYGLYVESPIGGSAISNYYGIYLANQTTAGGLKNYALYSSGTAKTYFGGNVGINDISPEQKLTVAGNILASTSGNVDITLKSTTEDDANFTIRTSATANSVARLDILGSASQTFVSIASTGYVGIGTTIPADALHVIGDIRTSACVSDGAGDVACVDVAETYNTSEPLSAGDIVSIDSSFIPISSQSFAVKKATHNSSLVGVVSTRPAILIEGTQARFGGPKVAGTYQIGDKAPIALAGRVPVKVSTENGNISPGDRLTVSSTNPGIAVKATSPGMTIGIALEPFPTNGQSLTTNNSTILAFVNLSYWAGSVEEMMTTGDTAITSSTETLFKWMVSKFFEIFNIVFENGIIRTVQGVFDKLEVKQGTTMYDDATGSPYCIKVRYGSLISIPGQCGAPTLPISTSSWIGTEVTPAESIEPIPSSPPTNEVVGAPTPEDVGAEPSATPEPTPLIGETPTPEPISEPSTEQP